MSFLKFFNEQLKHQERHFEKKKGYFTKSKVTKEFDMNKPSPWAVIYYRTGIQPPFRSYLPLPDPVSLPAEI